jgi:aryl-alcohol dehydrogenase-like predicted oxidoreductase
LSVAWILANPAITSVILGASQDDQLTATLDSLETTVKAKLDELSMAFRTLQAYRTDHEHGLTRLFKPC